MNQSTPRPRVLLLLAVGLVCLPSTALRAQDLVSISTLPSVFFDDTNDEDCTPSYDWRITTSGGTSNDDINNHFVIVGVGEFSGPCAQDVPIITLNHDGNSGPSSSQDTMTVLANGTIHFASGAVSIDRANGFVAIGTTAVQDEELTVRSTNPEIALQDADDNSEMNLQYEAGPGGGRFAIEGTSGEQDIVLIRGAAPEGSLFIEETGNVGIGTTAPGSRLHVAGAATIGGDLSVLSSRSSKHDLQPVSSAAILAQLEELDIVSWRYLDDSREARHVGPMAEEFHQLFGLGADGSHISPTDTAGVALAAAQELLRLVRAQQEELERLRLAVTSAAGPSKQSSPLARAPARPPRG